MEKGLKTILKKCKHCNTNKPSLCCKQVIEVIKHSNYTLHFTRSTVQATQLVITCSKSTIETLEQGVKYVQS